jgi:gluconokinase
MNTPVRFIVVMGVSGCGKSTVGMHLGAALSWDFYDADDFHPAANVNKMASGIPLDDDDRLPWLKALHDLIARCLKERRPGVLACSALKQRYRDLLLAGNANTRLVYLRGDYETILRRMERRIEHYMKPEMLRSQFEDLEEPDDTLTVDASLNVDEITRKVLRAFGLKENRVPG